jgi:hypothetical protein
LNLVTDILPPAAPPLPPGSHLWHRWTPRHLSPTRTSRPLWTRSVRAANGSCRRRGRGLWAMAAVDADFAYRELTLSAAEALTGHASPKSNLRGACSPPSVSCRYIWLGPIHPSPKSTLRGACSPPSVSCRYIWLGPIHPSPKSTLRGEPPFVSAFWPRLSAQLPSGVADRKATKTPMNAIRVFMTVLQAVSESTSCYGNRSLGE